MSFSASAARRGKPKIRPPRRVRTYIVLTQVGGIKELTIQPASEEPMQETWRKLAAAIRVIQDHNASKLSFEEIFRYAYNLVLFKHGELLYNGVRDLIAEHLDRLAEERIVPTFPRSSGTAGGGKLNGGAEAVERALEGDRFLKAVKSVWEDHTGSMRKLRDVLKYMDKVYTEAAEVPKVNEMGLTLFLGTIVRSARFPIHTHLIATLLSQVQLERDGEPITRSTVRECVDILLRLTLSATEGGDNVYTTDFEPEFLRRSGDFYIREAGEMLERGDASLYLKNVEKRLAEETDRTGHYLSSLTQPALTSLLVAKLLTPNLEAVLQMPGTGLVSMVDADRIPDLRRLYDLFIKVPEDKGKLALRLALRTDIEERGKAINEGSTAAEAGPSAAGGAGAGAEAEAMEDGQDGDDAGKKDVKGKGKAKAAGGAGGAAGALASALRWVQDVLDLKDKVDTILDQAFLGDKQVQMSINEAFQSFINANPRAPEFLSLYIDEHLKKGTKIKSEDEIERALDKTIVLFRFLSDKDKFERYYKNHLAKRLLYARSASEDSEKEMVAKLKIEMGFQFTQKLEGMFNDMRLSADSAPKFRKYLDEHRTTIPLDLTVSVLTASYWPPAIIASSPLTLPEPLSTATATFQKYYDHRHTGRRLTWQGNLGSVDMRVRFKSRAHEINMSTAAAVVVLLFDGVKNGEALSYADIKKSTDVADTDLQRTLQSLACGKYRILTKNPKGRDVNPDDTFTFNETFTCPLARFKIMQVVAKVETAKEREETEGMVDEERRHQVEACIVRIMKNRKQLSHNDLISEVAHQLASRFNPSMSLIKKRIEGLIDREYLERTNDIGVYRYLA